MQTQNSILQKLRRPTDGGEVPTGWRRSIWVVLLVAASVAFSLGFACAMPFAGLGAAAALTLNRRDALLLSGAAWLANQVVGFAFLDYPWDGSTLAWGVVLGVVAVLATVAAQGIAKRLAGRGAILASVAAFAGAFAVYEGGLFVVSATWLGGIEDFVPTIVARILAINAAAFAALLVASRLGSTVGLVMKPLALLAETERHA